MRRTKQTFNIMENRNILSQRFDSNKQIPTMLFEKWEFEGLNYNTANTSSLPQSKFNCLSSLCENTNVMSSSRTPLMTKKAITTPKAPIKQKKYCKKIDLKPKKLMYTEEELKNSDDIDSGIHTDVSSDTLFSKQHTVQCNRLVAPQRRLRARKDEKVVSNVKNSVTVQESSIVFNPTADGLSQCDDSRNWRDKLQWLQPRRDVGLWIKCCRKKCGKWRYAEEYHDPVDVPKIWYCDMSHDKSIASCKIPEIPKSAAIESDLIENKYNAGSIVWARVSGFPWWPGIVDDDPESITYYKLRKGSITPTMYHVTFFNEKELEHSWISIRQIKPFVKTTYKSLVKRTVYRGIDYKQDLDKAHKLALSALPLSILQRLRKFSFSTKYNKLHNINNLSLPISIDNMITVSLPVMNTSDEEIPPSYSEKKHLTLKEFYMNLLSKKSTY